MFNPKDHLIQLPRRVKQKDGTWTTVSDEYLEVKWRLVMFREKYPHGIITTEEICVDLERGYARFKATVADGEGGQATGYGTETKADFADFVERAETRALGRALAVLGFGTQFVGQDLTEGDHVVDAPVTQGNGRAEFSGNAPENSRQADPEPPTPLTADEVSALVELAHSVGVASEAFGHDMRRLLGLAAGTKVTKKLLRERLTRAQYAAAEATYQARLKQEVEQSLAEADVPDHPPPTANGPGVTSPMAQASAVTPPNGPAELPAQERLRWGVLSRRSMQVGLSPTVWESLRAGEYAVAERVIVAFEGGNGHGA